MVWLLDTTMTVAKEMATPRPPSAHRLSAAAPASSLPSRHSRTHSQSLSLGSMSQAHRVTRRKSMTSPAMAAAAQGAAPGGLTPDHGGASTMRRPSKPSLGPRAPSAGNYASMPSSLPNNGHVFGTPHYTGHAGRSGSAITDGPPLAGMPENEKGNGKNRFRRASEGSRLNKGDPKRASGSDLKCEKCGKGYKHSSCLTKHLWEHTPEWAFTSKLLISKHQQVQLLEAASVLVTMQEAGELAKDSDRSTSSPAASGSSDLRDDDLSSTDTTPPPQLDEQHAVGSYPARHSHSARSKRYSNNSSAYSQSYQSAIFSDSAASHGHSFGQHYRQWSSDGRPTTSGTSVAGSYYEDEEQADLAAAVGLLSCSYGTPKSGPVMLPPDVPPVPPLPAKFLGHGIEGLSRSTTTLTPHQSSIRTQLSPRLHENKDVRMRDHANDRDDGSSSDDDFDLPRHHRIDEDEGVFGRMEE